MVRCLSNAVLEFDNGAGGKAVTSIGFCELPDWVEKTEFYQMAAKSKIITPFKGHDDEKALKKNEATQKELAEVRAKLEAAEMELDKLRAKPEDIADTKAQDKK
jgi:hypothetical protein